MKLEISDWDMIPYAGAWSRQTEWFDALVHAKQAGEGYVNHIGKIHRTYHQRMWHSLKTVEIIFHTKNPLSKPKETIVKFLSNFSLITIAEFVLQLKIFCNFIAKFDLIKWH